MFAKPCEMSLRIKKLQALYDGRMDPNHPDWPDLVHEYKNRMAGYHGEKSVDFYLSMLPEADYQIYHDIRLLYGKYYFQIDILLLCAMFGLALEVKNRSGEIHFKRELNQAFCRKNGQEERIKNPVLQAKLQARKLNGWLLEHHFPNLPIHYLFVNSNEKTLITAEHGNEEILRNVCNSEFLIEKIEQIKEFHKIEKLSSKDLKKVNKLLLSKHTPDNPDILKQFHLSPKEIPTGVKCPDCRFLPMIYHSGTWWCPKCNAKSKTAHIPALNDYFLLIKPTITNSELREFLHIDSIRVASHFLTAADFPHSGTFKDRVYHHPVLQ